MTAIADLSFSEIVELWSCAQREEKKCSNEVEEKSSSASCWKLSLLERTWFEIVLPNVEDINWTVLEKKKERDFFFFLFSFSTILLFSVFDGVGGISYFNEEQRNEQKKNFPRKHRELKVKEMWINSFATWSHKVS